MQLKTRAISIPLASVIALGAISPAAASRVRNVSAEDALKGNVSISVHVEGGGVSLDFSPTQERIEDIAIDDPSRVVVDHCLVTNSCSDRPSPIIRLFRSNGIKFPDIPAAKTTLLSVETTDPQGEYHLYTFPVTIGNNSSSVSKIVIGGSGESTFKGGAMAGATAARTVALGAGEAESKAYLVDPKLKGRVRSFIGLLHNGMSSAKAAQKAGVSPKLVARLEQLGLARASKYKAKQATISVGQTRPLKPQRKLKDYHLQADALVRGVTAAKCQKKISFKIAAQVQDVIYHLRRGAGIAEAAKRAGVEMKTINQLLALSQAKE